MIYDLLNCQLINNHNDQDASICSIVPLESTRDADVRSIVLLSLISLYDTFFETITRVVRRVTFIRTMMDHNASQSSFDTSML